LDELSGAQLPRTASADLTPPQAMADRDLAAIALARAVRAGERIAVFGDYDVDGTTSAAIVGGILEQLGAQVTLMLGAASKAATA